MASAKQFCIITINFFVCSFFYNKINFYFNITCVFEGLPMTTGSVCVFHYPTHRAIMGILISLFITMHVFTSKTTAWNGNNHLVTLSTVLIAFGDG